MFDVEGFFRAVIAQDADALRAFFHCDAWVEWPCTNEHFTVEEYIRANCEYPGDWDGQIEKLVQTQDGFVMAARVYPKDGNSSFHATSFAVLRDEKIASMEEYWADDGPAPEWRRRMKIGKPICAERNIVNDRMA